MKKLFAAFVTLIMVLTLAACGEEVDEQSVDITLQSDLAEAELTQDPAAVTEGMDVTVTASAVEGYDFLRWVDADSEEERSTERSYTFEVVGPVTLEAVYEETGDPGNGDETYAVDVTSDLQVASLSVSQDGPYNPGEEITVEASEVDTYNFVRWIDADTETELSTERVYTFTVDQDLNLKAVFEDVLSENERTAQTIVDESSEDTAYLDTVMAGFDPAEGMSMTMHMAVEEENPQTEEIIVHDILVELATQTEGGNRLSKLSVHMDMPDMTEPLAMTMFMEETADTMTFTMDAAMILDMFEEGEDGLDVRTLLNLDSDYIYLTVPKDLEDTDQEVVYEKLMEAIFTQMFGPEYDEADLPEFDEAMMETLINHLDDLKAFMNFSHLSTYDEVDLVMERDGQIAKGTLSMGGDALEAYARDLFEQVYTTLELLDEENEMAPYSEVITTQDYIMFMGVIGMIPEVTMTMEYDVENETMHMDMDVYTLLNFFLEDDPEFENIQDITMEMTMERGATIDDDLSQAVNLEDIAEEAIQAFTVVDATFYLTGIAQHDIPADTYTLNQLSDMGHHFDLPFIDMEQSVVTIDDSGEETVFTIALYYAHNGQPVFVDTTVTMEEFLAVMGEEDPTDRQDLLDILVLVDDANFYLYPVLGDIMQAVVEQIEDEWNNPIPEGDQVDIDEPTLFDRYPSSVLTLYEEEIGSESFTFAVEADPVDVRDRFVDSLEPEWLKIDENEYDEEMDIAYELEFYNDTEEYLLYVDIWSTSTFDTGIEYDVIKIQDTSSQ